ncbi:hypothetical protein [Methanothermobacter sp. THM-2]|uniref:hypothetical protein n=1 Tax=Methanothermobacter sp. THM-2 TaxID=2606912 RepID=UPI0013654873|nr:hypothetical protein [Methanothermobacter sp. THM-2]QHN07640.1 hypothetical protein FZP68_02010 [Methanothermobacter sp. THM-2]
MIFSTDFLLSLIIVAIILGMSAELMDVQETRMNERFRETYTRDKGATAADILINTPGDPVNWEKLPVGACRYPGLAVPGKRGVISYEKIMKIRSRPELLERAFPGLHVKIVLRPLNDRISPIIIGGELKGNEIYVFRRTVNCNFLSDYVIRQEECLCPSGHGENWTCMNFRVNDSLDYYLISDGCSGSFILDTDCNRSHEEIKIRSGNLKLNLTGQGVVWIHLHGCGRGVIIAGLPRSGMDWPLKPEYFEVQPCSLQILISPY